MFLKKILNLFWSSVFKLEMAWSLLTNPSTAISTKCLMPHSLNISFWVVSSPNAALKVKGLIWPKLLSICKTGEEKKTPVSSQITKNHYYEIENWCKITTKFYWFMVEACVAEWLTPRTPDLDIQGSSLPLCIVSLDKELYSTLSLFTQVYQWVPVTYCCGVTLRWTSILSGMGEEKQRKERSNDQFKAKAHGNFPGPLLLVILLPCSDLI